MAHICAMAHRMEPPMAHICATGTERVKKAQVIKHKACESCLKTGHNAKNCVKRKICIVCGKLHNLNLHARPDVYEAFKKQKEKRDNGKRKPNETD